MERAIALDVVADGEGHNDDERKVFVVCSTIRLSVVYRRVRKRANERRNPPRGPEVALPFRFPQQFLMNFQHKFVSICTAPLYSTYTLIVLHVGNAVEGMGRVISSFCIILGYLS